MESAEKQAARRAVRVLNEALEVDPEAIRALFAYRAPCNPSLAGHRSIQVRDTRDSEKETYCFDLGVLGIINGIMGIDRRGHGPVRATYLNAASVLERFEVDENWVYEAE